MTPRKYRACLTSYHTGHETYLWLEGPLTVKEAVDAGSALSRARIDLFSGGDRVGYVSTEHGGIKVTIKSFDALFLVEVAALGSSAYFESDWHRRAAIVLALGQDMDGVLRETVLMISHRTGAL